MNDDERFFNEHGRDLSRVRKALRKRSMRAAIREYLISCGEPHENVDITYYIFDVDYMCWMLARQDKVDCESFMQSQLDKFIG